MAAQRAALSAAHAILSYHPRRTDSVSCVANSRSAFENGQWVHLSVIRLDAKCNNARTSRCLLALLLRLLVRRVLLLDAADLHSHLRRLKAEPNRCSQHGRVYARPRRAAGCRPTSCVPSRSAPPTLSPPVDGRQFIANWKYVSRKGQRDLCAFVFLLGPKIPRNRGEKEQAAQHKIHDLLHGTDGLVQHAAEHHAV